MSRPAARPIEERTLALALAAEVGPSEASQILTELAEPGADRKPLVDALDRLLALRGQV